MSGNFWPQFLHFRYDVVLVGAAFDMSFVRRLMGRFLGRQPGGGGVWDPWGAGRAVGRVYGVPASTNNPRPSHLHPWLVISGGTWKRLLPGTCYGQERAEAWGWRLQTAGIARPTTLTLSALPKETYADYNYNNMTNIPQIKACHLFHVGRCLLIYGIFFQVYDN